MMGHRVWLCRLYTAQLHGVPFTKLSQICTFILTISQETAKYLKQREAFSIFHKGAVYISYRAALL